MNRDIFSSKLYEYLRMGSSIVIASMLFLFTCIPVITFGASLSALYYTIVKVIRNEKGSVIKEYFRGFRMNFLPTLIPGILFLLYGLIMIVDGYSYFFGSGFSVLPMFFWLIMICFFSILGSFLFPVISRFQNGFFPLLRIAVVLMIQNIKVSFIAFALVMVSLIVSWFFIPIAFIVPGVMVYILSIYMEPILKTVEESQNNTENS